ncbi:hypothetical protein FHS35_005841 [Streptomyces umbrinus]|nr:hypothetical protein [Streptomyces umbrinus]
MSRTQCTSLAMTAVESPAASMARMWCTVATSASTY